MTNTNALPVCPRCHREIPAAGAVFCPFCGAPVAVKKNDLPEELKKLLAKADKTEDPKKKFAILTEAEQEEYESLLNLSGNGILGYIEIPSLKCSLPIYHGTDESVLQIAIGHIAGSSLPVGGKSTHCVLSGHRGLPSAKLFTDIDKLAVGDRFMIRVLDETLTYEVDQILIVEPQEMDALAIEPGKDLCTLVTCTPYGINTHRLLVRGHRVKNQSNNIRITADALQIDPMLVAPLVAAPLLLILLILLLVKTRKRR